MLAQLRLVNPPHPVTSLLTGGSVAACSKYCSTRRGDDLQDPSGARAGIPERSIARNVSGGTIGGRIGSKEIRRLRCTARL
jgi:hypothetical protein